MEETGTVSKITDDTAQITILPDKACKKCPAGAICRPAGTVRLITVKSQEGLKIGDKVSIKFEIRHSLFALFSFFGIPVILSFIGILFGQQYSEIGSLIAGTGGFIIGLVIAKIINDRTSRTHTIIPRITRVHGKSGNKTQP